jgi:hypothetical protein
MGAGAQREAATIEQALEYLKSLTGNRRQEAERYICHAPLRIDTPYRRKIEAALQWKAVTPETIRW